MSEVTITVSGPCGSGKSALLGEIEIMLKAMGVPVRFADEAEARAEKNGNHADWTSELELYQPSVVLVEAKPWLDTLKNADSEMLDWLDGENFVALHSYVQTYESVSGAVLEVPRNFYSVELENPSVTIEGVTAREAITAAIESDRATLKEAK